MPTLLVGDRALVNPSAAEFVAALHADEGTKHGDDMTSTGGWARGRAALVSAAVAAAWAALAGWYRARRTTSRRCW